MSGPSDPSQSDGAGSSRPHAPLSPNRSPRTPAKTNFSAIGAHLRGVAAFLAPQPQYSASETTATAGSAPPQGLTGLCNDLAEIGDSFKTGLSLFSGNKAIAGFSKIASGLLQFEDEDDRAAEEVLESDGGDGDGRGVPGINGEVLDFVKEISEVPECWTDFPLALENDFEMSDTQRKHALAIEHLAPSLKNLRAELQSSISQEQFWMIYFILLLSRLNKHDFELLSTPKITEVRDVLLQQLQNKKPEKLDSKKSKILDTSEDATEAKGENSPYRIKVVESHDCTVTDYTTPVVAQRAHIHEDYFSTGLPSLGPIQETGTSSPTESDEWVEVDVSQSRQKAMQSVSGEMESDWVHLNESKSPPKSDSGERKSDWIHVNESKKATQSASGEKEWESDESIAMDDSD